MDLQEFMRVGIPVMLYDRSDYYVKGGLAHDAYFRDSSGSVDWDLVGTEDFNQYVHNYLTDYAKQFGLQVTTNNIQFIQGPMTQYGFATPDGEPLMAEADDPYVVDILILPEEKIRYITMDGVNYMTLFDFVEDLLKLCLVDRMDKTGKYITAISKESGDIFKEVEKFNRKYGFSVDIMGKNIPQIRRETLGNIADYVRSNSNQRVSDIIIQGILTDFARVPDDAEYQEFSNALAGEFNDPYDVVDERDEDELQEMMDGIIEDYMVNVIGGVNAMHLNIRESEAVFRKYKRSLQRYGNIIDITWNNLTDKFKIYLLTRCRATGTDLSLFGINETCWASARCTNSEVHIEKIVDNCMKDSCQFEIVNKKLKEVLGIE